MSAHVCNPTHIATCAQIIREMTHNQDPPSEIDIRMTLAKENVASVAWRYGPEGQAAYAPLLGAIMGELMKKGWDANQIASPGAQVETDINEACFGGESTVAQYFMDCRTATPQPWTEPEAYMYLNCYSYQACEHPEWKDSEAYRLAQESEELLAWNVMKQQLEGRDVWEVEPEASDEQPADQADPPDQELAMGGL